MRQTRRKILFCATILLSAPLRTIASADALSLALYQSARDADSFDSETEALAWLNKMSRRLRFQIRDPFYRCELLRLIHREATRAGLAPELVMGVIQVESSFNRFAVSDRGARGLMQLMPFWMKEIGLPNDDLFNPAINLRYGCLVLRDYLKRSHGNVDQALSMYHGSLTNRQYANRVRSAMQSFTVS
ncbi:MAG: transglycosylase [marine bacterium B5-7]|nr:MAG: transglycosylase [marine bacterium B5-7]